MLTADLLALQRLDTAIGQDLYRRDHLAERAAAATAADALAAADRRRAAIDTRNAALDEAVAELERQGATLQQQRARLEGQLRTVTSVRQAEALEHELAALAAHRDGLDDQELGHLDEQSALAAEAAELDGGRAGLAAAADGAAGELATAEGELDAALTAQRSERAELANRLDAGILDRYEHLRARFGGVAVGALEGSRCSGCHLDLSSAELEAVRATPDGEVSDCPQCGRMLVP